MAVTQTRWLCVLAALERYENAVGPARDLGHAPPLTLY
jgi:hypothetical protein